MSLRRIARTVTPAPPAPGFVGEGHLAVMVVSPDEFVRNDPFILLADDRLELRDGQPAGGPHPHAGFETVTFMLEGSLHDRDEGVLQTCQRVPTHFLLDAFTQGIKSLVCEIVHLWIGRLHAFQIHKRPSAKWSLRNWLTVRRPQWGWG